MTDLAYRVNFVAFPERLCQTKFMAIEKATQSLTSDQMDRMTTSYGAEAAKAEQRRRVSAVAKEFDRANRICNACGGRFNSRGKCRDCEG